MSKRRRNEIFERIDNRLQYEHAVVQAYKSGKFLTKQIAETYGISPRSVQRIAKRWRAVRSQADGNRAAAPLAARHRIRRAAYRPR